MTRPGPTRPFGDDLRWLLYRQVRPRVWRAVVARRLRGLTDAEFKRLCGLPGDDREAVQTLHERLRNRLFFHPRNRKDFFLNVLTSLQPYDDILDEADEVLENKFETLGSGLADLGDPIDWHRDFKSGISWPAAPSHRLDLLRLDEPCDVKVPWELARFHQVWWLGKASWLAGGDRYANKFVALCDSWMDANPPGLGVHWAVAMEAAIRVCNWVAGYGFFCDSPHIAPSFWLRFFKSLYVQGVFIEQNLEYALVRGNHFIANVAGLVTLGVVFRGTPFGDRWYRWGTRQLEVEMARQVYPDGVSWEKSTSYQRLVLELFYTPALLAQLNGHRFSAAFHDRLRAMFRFVASVQRPDGTIPLFGDADDGRLYRMRRKDDLNDLRHALSVGAVMYDDPALRDAAGEFRQDALWLFGGEGFERHRLLRGTVPPAGSASFPDGGYYVLRTPDVQVVVDAGDLGMEGKGGHGHNDTLSFEVWAHGAPLIVDSGTYAYTSDVEARNRFRSVRAHNTVAVDGEEPAVFDGLWSVAADRTRPEVLDWRTTDGADVLTARHEGYARLHAPVHHERTFTLQRASGTLAIDDTLTGSGTHRFEVSFHLAPGVHAEISGDHVVTMSHSNARFRLRVSAGSVLIEPSWFSRSYGMREPNSVVRVRAEAAVPWLLETTIERLA